MNKCHMCAKAMSAASDSEVERLLYYAGPLRCLSVLRHHSTVDVRNHYFVLDSLLLLIDGKGLPVRGASLQIPWCTYWVDQQKDTGLVGNVGLYRAENSFAQIKADHPEHPVLQATLGALDKWRSRDLRSAKCAGLTTRILHNSPLRIG